MEKVIGKCPIVEEKVDGYSTKCLLDTVVEVSIITEEFFKKHQLPQGNAMKDITGCISITAANGLLVLYLGYVACVLIIMGKVFKDMGFLVTGDKMNPVVQQQRVEHLLIIGCNILQ